jgi:tRNA-binding EMAP/Myf-like protein
MGIESQGMVLAAGDKEVLALLNMPDEIPAGTKIK